MMFTPKPLLSFPSCTPDADVRRDMIRLSLKIGPVALVKEDPRGRRVAYRDREAFPGKELVARYEKGEEAEL